MVYDMDHATAELLTSAMPDCDLEHLYNSVHQRHAPLGQDVLGPRRFERRRMGVLPKRSIALGVTHAGFSSTNYRGQQFSVDDLYRIPGYVQHRVPLRSRIVYTRCFLSRIIFAVLNSSR